MPYLVGNATNFSDIQITNEIIGSGDGVQTSFNLQISSEKGQINSLIGDYTIGIVPHTWSIDFDGNITGTDLTGTFDGKDVMLNFSTAPDGDIVVSYVSQGIISQVVDFATSRSTKSEVIGTGDGIQTTFNFTLSNAPVALGQTLIRAKIDGVVYHAYPQDGVYDHPFISGTLVESTGVGSITTSQPVDDLFDIEVIYSDSAVPGRDWLLLREETSRDNSGNEDYPGELLKQVWLKNSGFSGKVANNDGGIVVAFRESKVTANNAFLIQGNIFKTFNESQYTNVSFLSNNADVLGSFLATGALNSMPTCPVAETNIFFTASVTKNHIAIYARSLGTVYTQIAGGCGNPMSSFLLYPKPYFMKGMMGSVNSVSGAASQFAGIHRSGTEDIIYIRPDGTVNPGSASQTRTILPRGNYTPSGSLSLKNTKNNKVLISPAKIHDFQTGFTLMEIPGVFFCPSNKISAEDNFTDQDGRNYDVFIEQTKVTEKDFFCVDKDL